MRTRFINKLVSLAEKNEKIFLICGDLGFSVLEVFRDKFPDRYLNIGIAEQNMAGVAAGLALEGYKVFIYSIGNFPSLRALEQIRYDLCYHTLDVTIVSVGAGFAYGPLGCSHHATEDMGILRSLPNMTVYSPCDPMEVEFSLNEIMKTSSPNYLRIGKAGEEILFENDKEISSINQITIGNMALYFATGALTSEIKKIVLKNKLDISLYSICRLDKSVHESVIELLNIYSHIHTYEEHQLNNGFGTFIAEIAVDAFANGKLISMPKITRHGINNIFIGLSGSQEYLRNKYILNSEI